MVFTDDMGLVFDVDLNDYVINFKLPALYFILIMWIGIFVPLSKLIYLNISSQHALQMPSI